MGKARREVCSGGLIVEVEAEVLLKLCLSRGEVITSARAGGRGKTDRRLPFRKTQQEEGESEDEIGCYMTRAHFFGVLGVERLGVAGMRRLPCRAARD